MKLSHYAKELGISYRSAWNYYKQGKIPNAYALPTGTIIVPNINISQPPNKDINVCIYARVSSTQNKNNLEKQAERLSEYCLAKGWKIKKIVKEIGSGLNDNRKQLLNIIKDINKYDYIIVEHKDRLTRMGFNYFNSFCPNKFHVVNESSNQQDDLMQDLVSIITSFCTRLYGQRRGKRKTEKIIQELKSKL